MKEGRMAFARAKWIWTEDNTRKNDWVWFARDLVLTRPPKRAVLHIAVETKYNLFLNNKLVVLDGGLNRQSNRADGYFDEVDVAKHLRVGKNRILIKAWYWGNQGRNNIDSGRAGLLVEGRGLDLHSDSSWTASRNPAHYDTGQPLPSNLYGGHNIGFDANRDVLSHANAIEYGGYGAAPWGSLSRRPIPLFRFSGIKRYARIEGCAVGHLPYAMQLTPFLKVKARGGETIDIRTDRYEVNGGPGDERNAYRGHRVEYVCRPGLNEFESLNWMFGEKVIYSIPKTVQIVRLGYRESGYDTRLIGEFTSNDRLADVLVKKSMRTLYCCMRENFMDCPDRERGQWIGDVSVQVPQVPYVLDGSALKLVRKAIDDFIHLRAGDVLRGNVPGACAGELPSQSLNAISELGMIAEYYRITGDRDVLRQCCGPVMRYLRLWKMGEDGLLQSRQGDWRWFDHLYNADEAVNENAWYYSALKFAQVMAGTLPSDLMKRKRSIEVNFDKRFWKGSYYSSSGVVDDRANALAVLSGLAETDKHLAIRNVLVSVHNATPYMENYVLEALCSMGYYQDAFNRMSERYAGLAKNENSTLWEDFHILGTRNHAWSGAPLTILFKHFAGISVEKGRVIVNRSLHVLERVRCVVPSANGFVIVSKRRRGGEVRVSIRRSAKGLT
ncbi:MAG: hypothetical protein WCL44_13495 [bacterium]